MQHTFAAVDLGSNSFHLVVAREVNGAIQWLDRLKYRVQLAQGLDENGELSPEAIARGRECLERFAERLQGIAPEHIRTVGTFTLRQAQNRDQALSAFAEVYPYPIEIISGHDEAELIYQGVAHTQANRGRRLVLDIGGGSTEMIVGEGFDVRLAESRPLGCVRDSVLYFQDDKPRDEQFTRAEQSALARIDDLLWDYRQFGWQEALGCSGTIRAISDAVKAYGWDNDGIITAEHLAQLKALWETGEPLLGVNEERQSVIGAGLAILSALFAGLRIERLQAVESALREGLLYGLLEASEQEIGARTVGSLQRHYHVDLAHANRVQTTLEALLRHTAWKDESVLRVALAAAAVHEVGRIVHHKGYQKHSAYLVQHSELNGFNAAEKALLVWLLRYQRKSLKGAEAEMEGLDGQAWHALLALRLALLLQRQRQDSALPEMMLSALDGGFCLEFAPNTTLEPLLIQALHDEKSAWEKLGIPLTLALG